MAGSTNAGVFSGFKALLLGPLKGCKLWLEVVSFLFLLRLSSLGDELCHCGEEEEDSGLLKMRVLHMLQTC